MTRFHRQVTQQFDCTWDEVDERRLTDSLCELFKIKGRPELGQSFKPFVLLFDEYYTDLYRMPAERMMDKATVWSLWAHHLASTLLQLRCAMRSKIRYCRHRRPTPVEVPYRCHLSQMTALEYIRRKH